jgi:hypothetical protein
MRVAGLTSLSVTQWWEELLPAYLPLLMMGWCSGRLLVAAGADVYATEDKEAPVAAAPAAKKGGAADKEKHKVK